MIREQHTVTDSTTTKYYRSLNLDRYNSMSTVYLVQSENTAEFVAIIGRLHSIDDDRVKVMPASRSTERDLLQADYVCSRPQHQNCWQQLRC